MTINTETLAVAPAIRCDNAMECTDTWINNNPDVIGCNGAFSCVDANIQPTNIHGVNESSSTLNLINCHGSSSCESSSIISETHKIHCEGANSCRYATIKSDDTFTCLGYQSCSYSSIEASGNVSASGAYSLYHSTIISSGTGSKIDVTLQGYHAAFGVQFICQNFDSCIFNCNGNSCEQMHIECSGVCLINMNSGETISPTVSIPGIVLMEEYVNAYSFPFTGTTLSYDDDTGCNSKYSTKYDLYNERLGGDDILVYNADQAPICCRGTNACSNVGNIQYNDEYNKNIITCSAQHACSSYQNVGLINSNNGSVYCSGSNACVNKNISATDTVYCSGSNSCTRGNQLNEYMNIFNAQNVFCLGTKSCSKSIIKSTSYGDMAVYLLGVESGKETEIYCNENDTCKIICGAFEACSTTTFYCHSAQHCKTKCTVDTGCPTIIFLTSYPTAVTTNPPTVTTFKPTIYPTIGASTSVNLNPNTTMQWYTSQHATTLYDTVFVDAAAVMQNYDMRSIESTLGFVMVLLAVIFILFASIGFMDARCFRINDFYNFGAIIQALFQVLDMVSDIFFAADIVFRSPQQIPLVFYFCVLFIVAPALVSLFQVHYFSNKIWSKDDKVRDYLLHYSKLLYITSILTGSSFAAIEIMNCHFFGLRSFAMNLSQKEKIQFRTQRIYSIAFLENIPQVAIQIWYIIQISDTNMISISSIIFSVISIVVTILSMTMENKLSMMQEHTVVKMDVIGKSVVSKLTKCQKRVQKIRKSIAPMIGVEYSLIEILKPRSIRNGLQLQIHLYVSNTKSQINKYSDLFSKAKADGSLAQIVFEAWQLNNVPTVCNLKCMDMISDKTAKIQRRESRAMSQLQIAKMTPSSTASPSAKTIDTMMKITIV